MAGEGVHFLAVDEDLHALDGRQVDGDGVDDRVDGEQFVEAAAAVIGDGFLREVHEGRAVLGDEDLPHAGALGDGLREGRRCGLQLRLHQGARLLGGGRTVRHVGIDGGEVETVFGDVEQAGADPSCRLATRGTSARGTSTVAGASQRGTNTTPATPISTAVITPSNATTIGRRISAGPAAAWASRPRARSTP